MAAGLKSAGVAHKAIIGLGGNLGDPEAAMASVLQELDGRGDTDVVAVSGIYRTPPWGVTEQPDFLNAAALLSTTLSARELLDVALAGEIERKRVRDMRWGPRTIDIDIIDHDGGPVDEEGLTIPHPRATQRAFVMVPTAEIAPEWRFDGNRAERIAAGLDATGVVRLEREPDWWAVSD